MSVRATIGLEIHIQLKTASKLFCACPNGQGDAPNRHICPICLGHPGTLPRVNRRAVELALRVVCALGMDVAAELRFERKQYFYPDLGKNYQTSQFASTLGQGGRLEFDLRGRTVAVRLREAHLEEDAARLVHGGDESMVDYNRGGTPLLEIVTEPDLHIGEEAEALLRALRVLVRVLGASDADMELAQLRCDANISVAGPDQPLGERVELKNLNSPRFVRLAIAHETERQMELLRSGGRVVRETRTWNENRGVTEPMRSKELAHDYRYLIDPDLPLIRLRPEDVAAQARDLPELPRPRAARLRAAFGLDRGPADELAAEPVWADLFEATASRIGDGPLVAGWVLQQVRALHKQRGLPADTAPLDAARLAGLLALVQAERVSPANAARILSDLIGTDAAAEAILQARQLEQISDPDRIAAWVDETLAAHGPAVEDLRQGKGQAFQFLVGQVLRASRGRANPRLVRTRLQGALDLKRIAVVDMGGAITAGRDADGALSPADAQALEALVDGVRRGREQVQIETVPVCRELSENLSPAEWHALYETLAGLIQSQDHLGLVVTHGLDTLAYTASLMRWLLPQPALPVVFTGACRGPGDPDSDAPANLARAVDLAAGDLAPGFWVSEGPGPALPAVNLTMAALAPPCMRAQNLDGAAADPAGLARGQGHGATISREALEAAVRSTLLIKVYPGLEMAWLSGLLAQGVRYLLLELFDTGTANTRWGHSQSLLPLIRRVRAAGGAVFCTSQLGAPVDLDGFASSRDLWNAGVVPLGRLTTESAYTKLIAAQLCGGEGDELIGRMAGEEFRL